MRPWYASAEVGPVAATPWGKMASVNHREPATFRPLVAEDA
jgi:hypothetical protein